MEAVHFELGRLARGLAGAVGGRRAARWHLALLVLAVLLGFVHRSIHALPLFDHLAGRWLPAFAAGAVLYGLGPVLRVLASVGARPSEDALARDLDDRFAWRDETQTAHGLADAAREEPLAGFLAAQTTGRLREIRPADLLRVRTPRRWPRRLLALLFVALLLLPGVGDWFGDVGAGTQGDGVVGSEGPDEPVGAPRPMRADFWLQVFAQQPMQVEALAPTPAQVEPVREVPPGAGAKGAANTGRTGGGK